MFNVGSERIARHLPKGFVATHRKPGSNTLYLTFDDGPNATYTQPLCDLLDRYKVKATFFCIGKHIDQSPEIAEDLLQRGHLLANHSQNHKAFSKLSLEKQLEEIENCQLAIQRLNPASPKVFRAPQGHLSVSLLLRLKQKGWKVVHWSYDSHDYEFKQVTPLMAYIENKPVTDGDVLLFHDDAQVALDALERLLPKWIEEGYSFETVDKLIA
tara:strand:- start:678 stop:1316 length:639 start_codon:yes stop_codon:yes gene_type:complete